jgi:hemolysin III
MKPKLRGVFHEIGFYLAVVAAVTLVWVAGSETARVGGVIYAVAVALCFGASALYHRPTWSAKRRAILRRIDHAGVFLLIAGTYTPVALLVLRPGWRLPVLAVVWGGALLTIVAGVCWLRAPKFVSVVAGIVLGWVGVVALPQILRLPAPGYLLIMAGGALYTLGAVVYARERLDPYPVVFGYHEVFHLFTLGAAGCQYAAIAAYVLPRR